MPSSPTVNRYDLHRAALNGDDQGVSQALETGADINSLDEEGRTPIMCAVAGDRWQEIDASDASFMTSKRLNVIRIMLHHPQISLHCLNAPHTATNGVIPLSMAAWLNFPKLVKLLLEESADTVAVDGLDAHGATALMYAARDNSLQVVQLLLSHGARPDLRDCNFRSSIQYAIPHPQILWLCESVLRRHRWRESQSTDSVKLSINASSETTVWELLTLARCSLPSFGQTPSNTLVDPPPQSIFTPTALNRSNKNILSALSNSTDIPFLRSLLFSPALPPNSRASLYPLSVPILVNRPDERGWSVIHHACSFTVSGSSPSKQSSPERKFPEIEVLDILYLAGADVSLFTAEEHYTPLHILAKTSTSVPATISQVVKEQIRDFITHLVRDLSAPLGARDKNDETCLHIAAKYGANKVVMDILLDLDHILNDGRVSKMKNAHGFLAVDLAVSPELLDSFAAIKEKMDMASIRRGSVSSALSDNTIRGSEKHASLTAVVVDEFGIARPASGDGDPSDPLDIDPTEKIHALLSHLRAPIPTQSTLDQMEAITDILITHFQARITAARKEVDTAKRRREAARANERALGAALCLRTHNQPPNGAGMVNQRQSRNKRESEDSQTTRVSSASAVDACYTDASTQTTAGARKHLHEAGKGCGNGQSWTEWLEGLVHIEDSTLRKKKAKKDKKVGGEGFGEFGFAERQKCEKEKEKGTISGAHKLKHWWKRIMVAHDPHSQSTRSDSGKLGWNEKLTSASMSRLELAREFQGPADYPLGRESKLQVPAGHVAPSVPVARVGCETDAQASTQTTTCQEQCALILAGLAEKRGEWTIGKAFRTAPLVLGAVRKDLERIETYLLNAEEFLRGAELSVERVGRVMKRALKKRRTVMDDTPRLRASTPTQLVTRNTNFTPERRLHTSDGSPPSLPLPSSSGSPGLLGYTLSIPLRPSYSSISSVSSDCSTFTTASNVTVANHPRQRTQGQSQNTAHQDDDETRSIRRLLVRRIEAQLCAAYEEVDKVVNWISIVQDVIGGVKRRTYL